jgi:hypothetical protein
VSGIFFNVSKCDRPDGQFIEIHLFHKPAFELTPAEYTCLKMFFLEANRLYRISSHRVPEDPGNSDIG